MTVLTSGAEWMPGAAPFPDPSHVHESSHHRRKAYSVAADLARALAKALGMKPSAKEKDWYENDTHDLLRRGASPGAGHADGGRREDRLGFTSFR
ncbi:MAG: hypothetical protein R3F13_19530 [Prosthecobacter sp.]